GTFDLDVGLFPGPARSQVHSRAEHVRPSTSASRVASQLAEHCYGHVGCPVQCGVQRQMALQQTSGPKRQMGAIGCRAIWLYTLEPSGCGCKPGSARGRWCAEHTPTIDIG